MKTLPLPLQRKVEQAITKLCLDAPFFGRLAMGLKYAASDSVDRACTDGVFCHYNPVWLAQQSVGVVAFVNAHEALHPSLGHLWRIQGRDLRVWNMACDYVINGMLVNHAQQCQDTGRVPPWEVPPDILFESAFDGLAEEVIYSLLMQRTDGAAGECSTAPGGIGDFVPAPGDEALRREHQSKWEQALSSAVVLGKSLGQLPAGLERTVNDILNPPIPFEDYLRQFVTSRCRDDYSWRRPNTRYASTGAIMPGLESDRIGHIAVAVDTSGSVGQPEFDHFIGLVRSIMADLKPSKLTVILCDAAIGSVGQYLPQEEVDIKLCGGGGTDFRPVFDAFEKGELPDNCKIATDEVDLTEAPDCLVYLTDGYGIFPEAEPPFPVLWAITRFGITSELPFGERGQVDV